MSPPVFESSLNLPRLARGKVRDIYDVGNNHLLIVTSDRLSAFDVVLPDPIPGKGAVLTAMALFWFEKLSHVLPNQLTDLRPEDFLPITEHAQVCGRALVVKRLMPLPIEAVVRGYLSGSAWKDYQQTGQVCGLPLPAGLKQACQLPEPLFTPASKAEVGEHDENINFEHAQARTDAFLGHVLKGTGKTGADLVCEAKDAALRLYTEAAAYAAKRGILIADTKFEFGIDAQGRLHLIDEVLTPDSSRFWPAHDWKEGHNPPSYDKQYVRDYLETLDWDKTAPGPHLPADVIARTAATYREAYERLTGNTLCL